MQAKSRMFCEQQGLCHYCHEPMFMSFHEIDEIKGHPQLATIEHLDDKFSPERGRHPGEKRVVLACWKCNHDRGHSRQIECADEHRRRTVEGQRRAREKRCGS